MDRPDAEEPLQAQHSGIEGYTGAVYESVADDDFVVPNHSFRPFGEIPMVRKGSVNIVGGKLSHDNPDIDSDLHKEPGMNTFKYMIGAHSTGDLPNTIINRLRGEKPEAGFAAEPPVSPTFSRGRESFILTENLQKSFAYNKNFAEMNFNEQKHTNNESPALVEETWDSPYYELRIPYTEECTTKRRLEEDSYGFRDMWYVLKSPVLHSSLLFGLRSMIFAVVPAFILVQHPNTKSFFLVGQMVPIFAAALGQATLGAQIKVFFMMCQAALFLAAWGTFLELTNLLEHPIPWWFAMFVIPFLANLCGDLPSKRLIMVFSVMLMEMEYKIRPSPEQHFPLQLSKDFFLGSCFAMCSALLPFPVFAAKIADERMNSLHALLAAGVGNAVKGFWAPVLLDAEIAVKQLPWMKIRSTSNGLQEVMGVVSYEPVEGGLKNTYRGSRLKALGRVQWCLYSLSAASSLNNELRKLFFGQPFSDEFQQTADVIQRIALKASGEVINVITSLGRAITPKEVLEVDFEPLKKCAQEIEDLVNSERDRTLLSQKFSRREANHLLRLFAFHSTITRLCREVIAIETWAMNEDSSSYPSFVRRAINFIIGDYWRNFWIELPHRMLLSTPRDVRMVKDSIRYAIALVVVVAYSRAVTAPAEGASTYYFGMAIFVRIAQQTASETVQIGLMRICGLAFGSSFGYLISVITTDLWYSALLLGVLGFLGASFGCHPVYSQVGQYAVITTVAGLFQARTSSLYLLSRISANVVAFGLYLIICVTVFPVDPAIVTFNYQSQTLKESSDITQCLVSLGCCPITLKGEEGGYLIRKAETILENLRNHLQQALNWASKAAMEPIIRGDNFPTDSFNLFFLRLAEMAALQKAILESMRFLHKPRKHPVSPIVFAIFELIRPFLIDIGKIIQRYCQLLIESCDSPRDWNLEKAAGQLWRAELSLISLRTVTGNIQRCFVAAIAPESPAGSFNPNDLYEMNAKGEHTSQLEDYSAHSSFADLLPGVKEAVIAADVERRDFCIFENIVVRFMLLVSSMTGSFESAIRIHQYQLSRF